MQEIKSFPERFFSFKCDISKLVISAIAIFTLFYIGIRVGVENYLLFHICIEFFSILISFGILIISWNTYASSKAVAFVFLGIGYGSVGFIDVFHSLTYKGMNIISVSNDPNIATQLWISARYIEALSILISLTIAYKSYNNINPKKIVAGFFIATVIIILAIFRWNMFPHSFIEGVGLTPFKLYSEKLIIFILLCSLLLLYKIKSSLNMDVYTYMFLSTVLTIISELCFMIYNDVYGLSNIIGHNFKALSFYYVYKAIIEVNLKDPYRSLFNKLNSVNNRLQIENSQRLLMEEIILGNNECYNLIIKNSKDAIFIHLDNKVIFANEGLVELIGASNYMEVVGREVISLYPSEVKGSIVKRMKDRYSNKKIENKYETKLLKDTGEIIDIETRATYFNYKGGNAILAIVRDISSQKQVQKLKVDICNSNKKLKEAEESKRLITEVFSNISHELKTPLNVILGAVQVMKLYCDEAGISDDRHNRYLKVMKQNCYRLLRLVNNIIDLSKLDSGYMKLNLSTHNIVNVVEDITLSVAEYIENKGLNLIFDTDIEEKIMEVDADKIERIILNLLTNAIKFTNPGGEIFVNVLDKKDWVYISVKDTGVGIPEDKQKVIFDRFGQVERTLKRNKEGSGIGLALVKSLVDLHEGEINIISKLGEGTEIIIKIPVNEVASKKIDKEINLCQSRVETISIEFSDIYA